MCSFRFQKLIKNALKFDILEKIMCVLEVSKMATILHFYKTKSHFYVYCWLQKQKTHKVFQHRQCRVCKGGTASQRTEDNCVLICKCINFSSILPNILFVGEFCPKIIIRQKLGCCFAAFQDIIEGCYVTNVTIRFKGAVVTTKPRRRRRGRGAAAIIKKCGWMGG